MTVAPSSQDWPVKELASGLSDKPWVWMPVSLRARFVKDWKTGICMGGVSDRRPTHKPGYVYKRAYHWDVKQDRYRCPAGETRIYTTTDRLGDRPDRCDPKVCSRCDDRARCTRHAKAQKAITRPAWEDRKERTHPHRLTDQGNVIDLTRQETVARRFADAKPLTGYR